MLPQYFRIFLPASTAFESTPGARTTRFDARGSNTRVNLCVQQLRGTHYAALLPISLFQHTFTLLQQHAHS